MGMRTRTVMIEVIEPDTDESEWVSDSDKCWTLVPAIVAKMQELSMQPTAIYFQGSKRQGLQRSPEGDWY